MYHSGTHSSPEEWTTYHLVFYVICVGLFPCASQRTHFLECHVYQKITIFWLVSTNPISRVIDPTLLTLNPLLTFQPFQPVCSSSDAKGFSDYSQGFSGWRRKENDRSWFLFNGLPLIQTSLKRVVIFPLWSSLDESPLHEVIRSKAIYRAHQALPQQS